MTVYGERKLWSVDVISWVGEMFGTEPGGDIAYGLALSQNRGLIDRIQDYIDENPLPGNRNEMIAFLVSLIGENIEEEIDKHRRFLEIIETLAVLRACVQAYDNPIGYATQDTRTPAEKELSHRFDPARWTM